MAKKKSVLAAATKVLDPELSALFASSSGPVAAPAKSRYAALLEKKVHEVVAKPKQTDGEEEDDEILSEASKDLDYDDDNEDDEDDSSSSEEDSDDSDDEDGAEAEASDASLSAAQEDEDVSVPDAEEPRRDRKRKRKNDNEDLEAKYLAELTKDDGKETDERQGKRQKAEDKEEEADDKDDEDEPVPVHESLAPEPSSSDVEKAARTVFLSNVSTVAISSKTARKTLVTHLSSALDPHDMPIQKFESIRFRSVAFSTGSMPKRAAYITKSLMESTTKSANAYAVFSSPAAARLVASKLNGSEVLGRHIRVDSVAHPSPTDHRRCVFVGNLGFVDDETVVKKDQDGEMVEKKRTKVPSDIEEGLWRTFGKKGKVENVRVVRDPKTRVGKGFAYVQFYDGNDVEAALLLDGKAFPPMLPRKLRVTRAKDPRKTALAQERSLSKANAADAKPRSGGKYIPKMTPEQQAAAGRAGKLFGRARGGAAGTGQKIVFEGNRASIRDALPKDLKGKKGKGKGKGKGKQQGRGAKRAAAWRKKQA